MTYEEHILHAEECERIAEAATLPSNRLPAVSG
jgi:hypothetical protein